MKGKYVKVESPVKNTVGFDDWVGTNGVASGPPLTADITAVVPLVLETILEGKYVIVEDSVTEDAVRTAVGAEDSVATDAVEVGPPLIRDVTIVATLAVETWIGGKNVIVEISVVEGTVGNAVRSDDGFGTDAVKSVLRFDDRIGGDAVEVEVRFDIAIGIDAGEYAVRLDVSIGAAGVEIPVRFAVGAGTDTVVFCHLFMKYVSASP